MKHTKLHSIMHDNGIFFIITIIVGLTALITRLFPYFSEPFYAAEYDLDSYVTGSFSDTIGAVIINGGSEIAVLDDQQRLLYKIKGGSEERAFSKAYWIYAENENAIYVADRVRDAADTYISKERIIKLTDHGRKSTVLYESEYSEEEKIQYPLLFDPMICQDCLYVAKENSKGIHIYRVSEDEVVLEGSMDLSGEYDTEDPAKKKILETDFWMQDGNIRIAAVLMNSKVYMSENMQEPVMIYDAAAYRTENYISIINDVDFDASGKLYLTDVGLRRVICYKGGSISDFITQNHFKKNIRDGFEYLPIYSGLNITGDQISLVSSDYIYCEETDSYENNYLLYTVDLNSTTLCCLQALPITLQFRCKCLLLYVSILLLLGMGIWIFVRFGKSFIKMQNGNVGMQIAVLITALVVTIFVSYYIFNNSKQRYMSKCMENITNIGFLIDARINKDYLFSLQSPESCTDPEYRKVNETINEIIHGEETLNENAYVVLYAIQNNIIYMVYNDDMLHQIMTPVEGGFEGTWEQEIIESGNYEFSESDNISEGSFVYVMIPIYDENGNPLGLLETGMNYNSYEKANSDVYHTMLVLITSVVIIAMLFLSELMNAMDSINHQHDYHLKKERYSPATLRPLTFLVFFTANIPVAFLPIYGTALWKEDFPFPPEIGAALPLSSAFIAAAVTSFAAGFIVKKVGITPICIAGALLYMAGNLFCAYADNLWTLILANAVSASGDGFFIMGLNYRISGFETEEEQNKGFVGYNGAYLSGMNCGMVVGSIICDHYGYAAAFYFGAVCAVVIIAAALYFLDHKKIIVAEDQPEESIVRQKSVFKRFFTPGMIRYLLFISVPYTICEAFLNYFYPIIAEENMISVSEISLAFLISGVISIYTGSAFGEYVMKWLGSRKAMLLASFIYASALACFVLNPTLTSCYIVIVMFSVADSFGLAANSVYFTARPETADIGQSKAIGINETLSSIVSSGSSIVFGGALLLGAQKGIMLITILLVVLLILFVILEKPQKKEMCQDE